MTAIIIPSRQLVQPQGRVDLSPVFGADYAYAPWMGENAVIGSDGPLFSQATVSKPLVSRGGVGTTYAGAVSEATAGPTIGDYPFALAAVIEVLPQSGNVSARPALGLGTTTASSPAAVGVTSDFIQDARPSFNVGAENISSNTSIHGRVVQVVGVAESATSRALYVDGVRIAVSSNAATMFQSGATRLSLHATREYNYGVWRTTTTNLRLLGGAWFKRALHRSEAESLSANLWQLFRADPVRIYSLPSGPISVTINSITASNITSSGARITLGLTR